MTANAGLALAASLLLAGVHLLPPALDRLPGRVQAMLGSLAGGIGLAYVFLYLLFELAKDGSAWLHTVLPIVRDPLETIFLVLWGAIVAAYLLYAWVARSPSQRDDHHVLAAFLGVYNLVAGAAVVEEARWGALNLGVYALALGLHLLFNDRHLQHLCPAAHTPAWRAMLAIAPVAGCALTLALSPPVGLGYLLLTLVAGFTIISVFRQELPDPQHVNLPAFLAGTCGYALLILATWRF